MVDAMPQPGYLVVPFEYESLLRRAYETKQLGLELTFGRQLTSLRKQYDQDLLQRDSELERVREEGSKHKRDVLAWRKKAVHYKIKLASAEEGAQLTQAHLSFCEGYVKKLVEEREVLLRGCKELQDQVQSLTALCRGQHRAKVQQQGELDSTGAEAKQLHAQLTQSHELAELLARQLANERAALEASRSCNDALREELSQRTSELQQQVATCSELRTQCDQLQATLKAEQEERAAVEARVGKLNSELAIREAERENAEQRLMRHMQNTAKRDELLAQEAQRIKAADDAVIQELRHNIDRRQALLVQTRQEAEEESRRQAMTLQRETTLREKLEAECARYRDRLHEEQEKLNTDIVQLRRQVGERGVENQMLQEKLDAAERKVSVHASRVAELEAAMERSTRHLGQQVTSRDAEMAALQEQLDQQRRKFDHKETELRDAQAAHVRQMELLQRRLAEQEASAQEHEAQLRRQIDSARQEVHLADSSGTRAQHKVSELEDTLAARDERFRQLQAERAAEQSRRDEQIRQLREGHAAQVAGLEARLRQLEQQLIVMPSPMEPQRYQVRSAAAAVDKLMGNLLGSANGFSTGGSGTITEDEDERGPSADLILRMSQQPLPQIVPATQPVQQAAAAETAVQPEVPPAAAPGSDGAGPSSATADTAEVAKPGTGKRSLEQCTDAEERPVGKGRGRKAAKAKEVPRAAVNKAAEPQEAAAVDEAPAEPPSQDAAPGGRPASRRRAAQSGQARAKAMAAALANDSGNETEAAETPGFEFKSSRAQRNATRASQKQVQAAKAAAQEAPSEKEDLPGDMAEDGAAEPPPAAAAAPPPAAKGRSRAGKGGKGSQAQDPKPTVQADAAPSGSGGPAAAAPAAAARELDSEAKAMPPPRQPTARQRGAAVDAAVPGGSGGGAQDADVVPATQELDLLASQPYTQQHMSQPPTQPQPAMPCRPAQQGPNVGAFAAASQVPASSQATLFSQGFRQFEPSLGKNPLAMLNPRIVEQAKNRMRLVPFTAVQQTKAATKVVPPNLLKGQAGAQQVAAKRPLPQLTQAAAGPSAVSGDVLPPDVLFRSLQQPQNKAKKAAH